MALTRREMLIALGAVMGTAPLVARAADRESGGEAPATETGPQAAAVDPARASRILAVNGSPRGRGSNTQRILAPLLEGAREEGASVDEVFLTDLDVRPCTGCFSCWTDTPGECIQQDDMAALRAKMLDSDTLVLGFGLYIRSAPAGVQAMMERMLPMAEPWLVETESGTTHPARHPDRPLRWTVIANCGFPEQSEFRGMRARFGQMGVDPITMPAGEFLGFMESAPMMSQPLDAFRSALRDAGRGLARTGGITGEARERINRPVIDWAGVTAAQYRAAANQSFGAALGQTPPGEGL